MDDDILGTYLDNAQVDILEGIAHIQADEMTQGMEALRKALALIQEVKESAPVPTKAVEGDALPDVVC